MRNRYDALCGRVRIATRAVMTVSWRRKFVKGGAILILAVSMGWVVCSMNGGHSAIAFLSFVLAALLMTYVSALDIYFKLDREPVASGALELKKLKYAATVFGAFAIFGFFATYYDAGLSNDRQNWNLRQNQYSLAIESIQSPLSRSYCQHGGNGIYCSQAQLTLNAFGAALVRRDQTQIEQSGSSFRSIVKEITSSVPNALSQTADFLRASSAVEEATVEDSNNRVKEVSLRLVLLLFACYAVARSIAVARFEYGRAKGVPS